VTGADPPGGPGAAELALGDDVRRSVDAVWRIESPRVIAGLARMVGDIGVAEDLAQDAVVAALRQWSRSGVPERPGAWLMAVGKRRAIDRMRRQALLRRKQEEMLGVAATQAGSVDAGGGEEEIQDDLLRLVFIACHPVLPAEARVALTLRLLGGLTTEEIARAFLVREATVAQRIVRAKRTLAEARVPFELPSRDRWDERLASVLEVVYLIFNEGYTATAGDDWTRPALCDDALRLGRVLAELIPGEPEVLGLVALMELQASRLRARIGPTGEAVLLLDQDRRRWDQVLVHRGLAALERAGGLGSGLGPYGLQAAIAACHARARTSEETDWARIAALYEALAQLAPSPVVQLNRAVALSMAFGPEAGLAALEAITPDPALSTYHLLPSVRGDLLQRLGRWDEARVELERAASLTRNESERRLLRARAAAARRPHPSPAVLPLDPAR
jgi:RNA polymerase sigma factor (sigma-70 family)